MRTLFAIVAGVVATAVLGPLVLVGKLFRLPEGPNSFYQRVMTTWARTLCKAAGVRIHIHGAENISRDHGVIYAANHVSWFDIFAIASSIDNYTFIAKAELARIPVFAQAAAAAGIVFLDRDNRKAAFDSYKSASLAVRNGRSVVVCPEGTRGRDYHLRPFKKGPFVLAIAAQAPVVPTLVYGAREVMRKGSFFVHPGDVHLHFLEPVPTAGFDYDHRHELMEHVWREMADAMRDLYGIGTNEFPIATREEQQRSA